LKLLSVDVSAEQLRKIHIQAFIRQASEIQTNKVFFNKDFIKKFKVLESCIEITTSYLGKDIGFLQDVGKVAQYATDIFGSQNMGLLKDSMGNFGSGEYILDMEHGLLLYNKLLVENSDLADKALGFLYFLAGHQLDEEFAQISKVAPRSLITPVFELDSKHFRWRRCNFVLRKYMLALSKPEGYTAYYYEKSSLGQIAYLIDKGKTFDEAETEIRSMTGGIFHTFMPMRLENYLLPSILNGMFYDNKMDGFMKQTLIRDSERVRAGDTIDDMHNVYNMIVKPNMVEVMGMVIKHINEELRKNDDLSPSDAYIHHVSPHRIGFLVKDTLKLEDVLPNWGMALKPVDALDLSGVPNGDFL
jgi:hypothetical protein